MGRNTSLKFPVKVALCFLPATATGLALHPPSSSTSPLASSAISSTFPDKITTAIHGLLRSSRAISTIALTAFDYKCTLRGLPDHSEEYRRKLSEVHLRSAKRLLKLCQTNKGFYVKAGQFAAALPQVPKEYSSTLSSLQDQAVPCPFNIVKEALTSNLGSDLSEIFLSIDEQPVAAASIAQVHHGVLKDHQEVAIKVSGQVQYPGLERQMEIDTATMYFISKTVAWLFPEYRFEWLALEFSKTISLELDFIQEARNSERAASNLKHNNLVRIPRVYWEWTTSQVLTMQFCRGRKVDDADFLKQKMINPVKVCEAVVDVFAEMIFVHGFLHGDPHPGNILVSPEDKNGFSLVLLDHGIYKYLDEEFRLDYCRLWKALIFLDSNKIHQIGERFGVGKYSRYLPLIFTARAINSKSALGSAMSGEEKTKLKQELKSLNMEDVSSFMESLPPDFITILRTDGLLRSIVRKLGASQWVRLLAYAKYALYGLCPKLNPETESAVKVAWYRLKTSVGYLHLRLILGALEVLSKLQKIKHLAHKLCRRVLGVVSNVHIFFNGYLSYGKT